MVMLMIQNLKNSFKETVLAIIPICIIVMIVTLLFGIDKMTILSFLISSGLLIIGISLFTFGADLSMMMIGERLGNYLIKSKKIWLIVGISFLIGIMITVAEPDLRVLADQISSIPTNLLIICVAIGVGIMLALASSKIIFGLNLRTILIICYGITFALLFFAPGNFVPVSFDSSGVTTGPISVPFILALGIGLTSFRTDSNSQSDTFGLIGLCAVGPKIAVLLLSLFFAGESNFDSSIYTSDLPLMMQYTEKLLECIKNVFISLSPIIALFLVFNMIKKDAFTRKQIKKIGIGLVATFLGLCLFLTGVDVGFMKTGFIMGQMFIDLDYKYYIFPFIMIIGFLVVFAEPAVKILTNQVEEITEGSVTSKMMRITLSIGVALAICLSVFRVLSHTTIMYILVITYLIAIILTFIAPKMFTALAFDAGGSVCGPLTATFILPFVIGICTFLGGDVMIDAFGLISFIAMSPLITVQVLGIIFKFKTRQEIYKNINEEVVDYDWRSTL